VEHDFNNILTMIMGGALRPIAEWENEARWRIARKREVG